MWLKADNKLDSLWFELCLTVLRVINLFMYVKLCMYVCWPRLNPHLSECNGPHSDAILICFELPTLLPPRWFPSLTNIWWLCSSSFFMDDLDPWTTTSVNSAWWISELIADWTTVHCILLVLTVCCAQLEKNTPRTVTIVLYLSLIHIWRCRRRG